MLRWVPSMFPFSHSFHRVVRPPRLSSYNSPPLPIFRRHQFLVAACLPILLGNCDHNRAKEFGKDHVRDRPPKSLTFLGLSFTHLISKGGGSIFGCQNRVSSRVFSIRVDSKLGGSSCETSWKIAGQPHKRVCAENAAYFYQMHFRKRECKKKKIKKNQVKWILPWRWNFQKQVKKNCHINILYLLPPKFGFPSSGHTMFLIHVW